MTYCAHTLGPKRVPGNYGVSGPGTHEAARARRTRAAHVGRVEESEGADTVEFSNSKILLNVDIVVLIGNGMLVCWACVVGGSCDVSWPPCVDTSFAK
jgi:hypothetical protein